MSQDQLTAFDSVISNKQMQILKSALPYIPVNEQHLISLYVKLQELKNTISLYDNHNNGSIGICSSSTDTLDNLSEMVNCIKPLCNEKEQDQLDLLYNIASAFTLSKNSTDTKKQSNDFQLKNMLRNFLSPEQQSLFDNYSLLFSNNLH